MGKPALDLPATRASQRRSHSGSLPSNHTHCRVGRDAGFYKTLFPLALPSPCKNPQTIKHLYPAFYAAIIFGSSTHSLPTAQQDCHPSRHLRCHPQRLEERLANPCEFRAALGSTNSRQPNYPTSPSRANPPSQKVIFFKQRLEFCRSPPPPQDIKGNVPQPLASGQAATSSPTQNRPFRGRLVRRWRSASPMAPQTHRCANGMASGRESRDSPLPTVTTSTALLAREEAESGSYEQ